MAAKADAAAKGLGSDDAPQYRFTLKAPSMIPVMEYADDESLRRAVWEGTTGIGRGEKHDNTDLVWKILRLRHEKAQIMEKANFDRDRFIGEVRRAVGGRHPAPNLLNPIAVVA